MPRDPILPPGTSFPFEEAPTYLNQYIRHLRDQVIELHNVYKDRRHSRDIVGIDFQLGKTIEFLRFLTVIMSRTIMVLHAPGFGERNARCYAEHHAFTAYTFVSNMLACTQYLQHFHAIPVCDHEGGHLWPEGCYHHLIDLANAHRRSLPQEYVGDTRLEEYGGHGPLGVLRDISVESGHLIFELVETARVLLGLAERLWAFPPRSSSVAASDAVGVD